MRTISGSTWLSFIVEAPGRYNCWTNGIDQYFFNVTRRNSNTVAGLNPGTSYNITCQQRMDQNCAIAHTTVTTSKWKSSFRARICILNITSVYSSQQLKLIMLESTCNTDKVCLEDVFMSTHPVVNVMSLILSNPEPNPPDQVTITQTTCNSVTVNWTPPTDNGNAGITGYRVHVYNDSDHVLMTETDTAAMHLTYKFSSLDSDANYTVEVKAMNVGGVGNGTSTNFTTNKKGLLCSGLHTIHKW